MAFHFSAATRSFSFLIVSNSHRGYRSFQQIEIFSGYFKNQEAIMAWKDIAAGAQRIIGKDGKLPKPAVDLNAVEAKVIKARAVYDASKQGTEKTVLALQNTLDELKNAYGRYDDVIDGADYGLDDSTPVAKKAIA